MSEGKRPRWPVLSAGNQRRDEIIVQAWIGSPLSGFWKILLHHSRASLPGRSLREPEAHRSRGTCGIAGNTAGPTGYTTVPYACRTVGPTQHGDHQDVFHHENPDLNRLRQHNRTMLDVPKVIWFAELATGPPPVVQHTSDPRFLLRRLGPLWIGQAPCYAHALLVMLSYGRHASPLHSPLFSRLPAAAPVRPQRCDQHPPSCPHRHRRSAYPTWCRLSPVSRWSRLMRYG